MSLGNNGDGSKKTVMGVGNLSARETGPCIHRPAPDAWGTKLAVWATNFTIFLFGVLVCTVIVGLIVLSVKWFWSRFIQ